MRLLRIVAPHFVAGVVVGERAAPIIRYMKHWSEVSIREYCERKKWVVGECGQVRRRVI